MKIKYCKIIENLAKYSRKYNLNKTWVSRFEDVTFKSGHSSFLLKDLFRSKSALTSGTVK